MLGFSVTGEGHPLKTGFNFYPLNEWSSSRGFRLKLGKWAYMVRWSVRLNRLIKRRM